MTGAERFCEVCGGSLAGRRRGAKFCGDRCRQTAHRAALRAGRAEPESASQAVIGTGEAVVTVRGPLVTVTGGCSAAVEDDLAALALTGALA